MAPRDRRRPTLLIVLATGITLAVSACGGASASTAKVASLSEGPVATDATASTEPLSDQASIVKFASCLRDQGLDVPDPRFDANGNLDGRIFERGGAIDPRNDAVRAAIETCRDLVGNVRLGPGGGRFNPEQMQAAFNDFTSCLRSQGLDVDDVTFRRPGEGGIGGDRGNGASGAGGRREGFGPPAGETGPREGQGFNPTRRLMRQLNLDDTDPKVTAAVAVCEPALTSAVTNATASTTTVAN